MTNRAPTAAPCAFCGSLTAERNSDRWGHFFFCDCGARGPYGNNPAEAFKKWNTRTDVERAYADAATGQSPSTEEKR